MMPSAVPETQQVLKTWQVIDDYQLVALRAEGYLCRKVTLVGLVDPAGLLEGTHFLLSGFCSGLAEGCVLFIWKLQVGALSQHRCQRPGLFLPSGWFLLLLLSSAFLSPSAFSSSVGSEFMGFSFHLLP